MLGLKRRHTYDELLNIIKSDGEKKVELPNRIASQIRGSIKYQGLLNDRLNELQEIHLLHPKTSFEDEHFHPHYLKKLQIRLLS